MIPEEILTPPVDESGNPPQAVENIRPEVYELAHRGRIHADEYPPNCNRAEASLMVPALVNSALALRINRVLANLVLTAEPGEDPILSPHALYVMADELARRIQHQPRRLWPNVKNVAFAERVFDSVEANGGRPEVSHSYLEALRLLSHEAAIRLERMCD